MKRIPSFNNEVYLKDNVIYKENKVEASFYPILKKQKIPTVRVKNIQGDKLELYYYPSKTIKEKPSNKSYITVGKIYRKLHRIKGNNTVFLKSIEKQFTNLPKYMQTKLKKYLEVIKGDCLLHCDPATTNILVGKHIKLIDFEFCRYGDPLYDIATFECKHPQKYHKYFYEGYSKKLKKEDIIQILFYKVIFENSSARHVLKLRKSKWAKERMQNRNNYYKELLSRS